MSKKLGLFRKRIREIQGLEQYSPSESLAKSPKRTDVKTIVKLDANENFFIPRSLLSRILKEIAEEADLRLYPQKEEDMLVEALKDYLGLPSDRVVLGNGSDQLIESIVKIFLKEGEKVVSVKPTFAMYGIIVKNQGNKYDEVSLNDNFSLNVDALLSKITPRTALCFICSPNNPTANQFRIDDVRRIIEEFNGIVIVDEAYAEFAPYSMVDLIEKFENLIVLRTFSKVFGLAGLRIGYAVSNPSLSGVLRKIQLPYNINTVSMRMALKILREEEVVKDALQRLKEERSVLIRKLNAIDGVKAFDSNTNFVLFKVNRDSDYVFGKLLEKGILIKDIGNILGVGGYFRTTIGLPEMNMELLNALEDICSG